MKRSIFFLVSLTLVCGCTSHKPAPEDFINSGARVQGKLPYPVMDWKVLSSSVDRNAGTISTLFGNDAAFIGAPHSNETEWPQGAVLGLVTWHAKEDAHWFGGRIPDTPASVEFLEIVGDGTRYRRFAGIPLTEQPATDPARAAAIGAMRPVRLP